MHFTYEVKQTTHLEMSIDIDEHLYTKQVASFSKGGGGRLNKEKKTLPSIFKILISVWRGWFSVIAKTEVKFV